MTGPLKLHYDYFFADYSKLPVPDERRSVVQTPDGPRPTKPGEADAQLFPIDLDRARDQRLRRDLEAAMREMKELRDRDALRDRQMQAVHAQLTEVLAELRGTKKAGSL